MLILTRTVRETLMVGNDVTVLGVKGNQVRVGINAPKNVAVHREEIFERIERERKTMSAPTPSGGETVRHIEGGPSGSEPGIAPPRQKIANG